MDIFLKITKQEFTLIIEVKKKDKTENKQKMKKMKNIFSPFSTFKTKQKNQDQVKPLNQ